MAAPRRDRPQLFTMQHPAVWLAMLPFDNQSMSVRRHLSHCVERNQCGYCAACPTCGGNCAACCSEEFAPAPPAPLWSPAWPPVPPLPQDAETLYPIPHPDDDVITSTPDLVNALMRRSNLLPISLHVVGHLSFAELEPDFSESFITISSGQSVTLWSNNGSGVLDGAGRGRLFFVGQGGRLQLLGITVMAGRHLTGRPLRGHYRNGRLSP